MAWRGQKGEIEDNKISSKPQSTKECPLSNRVILVCPSRWNVLE